MSKVFEVPSRGHKHPARGYKCLKLYKAFFAMACFFNFQSSISQIFNFIVAFKHAIWEICRYTFVKY
jgi:hypothetical protein